MTQTTATHNRSDRESGSKTLESLAEQKAANNQSAKRTTAGDFNPRYRKTQFAHVGID